eukprot:PITA_02265
MHNDDNVANYFLRIDEIVNCMKNLGEEIKEIVLVEKVLRSLSSKFDSKVSTIEEKQNLQSLTMSQLHGILTTYEMRKGGPSDRRETTFKASGKGDYNESGYMSEEEEESNFFKNLQWGTGRFRGKLPFKCFACGRVGHYATKCPHKDKRSPLIKIGLGYSEEASQAQKQEQKPSTSKSYLDAARRSEQVDNQ